MARSHSRPAIRGVLGARRAREYRLGDWPAAHATAMTSLSPAQSAGLDHETDDEPRQLCLRRGGPRSRRLMSQPREAAKSRFEPGSRQHDRRTLHGEAVGFLELGLGRIDEAIAQAGAGRRTERRSRYLGHRPCPPTTSTACGSSRRRLVLRRQTASGRAEALALHIEHTPGNGLRRLLRAALRRALSWSERAQHRLGGGARAALLRARLGLCPAPPGGAREDGPMRIKRSRRSGRARGRPAAYCSLADLGDGGGE